VNTQFRLRALGALLALVSLLRCATASLSWLRSLLR
jgi:hypothetical protein